MVINTDSANWFTHMHVHARSYRLKKKQYSKNSLQWEDNHAFSLDAGSQREPDTNSCDIEHTRTKHYGISISVTEEDDLLLWFTQQTFWVQPQRLKVVWNPWQPLTHPVYHSAKSPLCSESIGQAVDLSLIYSTVLLQPDVQLSRNVHTRCTNADKNNYDRSAW